MIRLFGGELDKIRLQKLLMLFGEKQTVPVYEFVPYKFGCYSFSAHADLAVMVRKELLKDGDKSYILPNKSTDYLKQVKPEDRVILQTINDQFARCDTTELMRFTYIHYPYYATRSVKATGLLNSMELAKVEAAKPKSDTTVLFTIGYEGVSIEAYLNKLIQNGVKLLVDVRNNPQSMKYGFSKSTLNRFCENVGVGYEHIPEVGIRSEFRKELKIQADYDDLFKDYRKNNLSQTQESQNRILSLLNQYGRIALTCFEADICRCHRKPLAEAVSKLPGFNFELSHI